MPVIIYVPVDPTDMLLQGEILRREAIQDGIHAVPAPRAMVALLVGGPVEPYLWDAPELVPGVKNFLPMMQSAEYIPSGRSEQIRSQTQGTLIRNNACIATPCGALYPVKLGVQTPEATFTESASRFMMTGVTKDSAGAALGDCKVVVLDVAKYALEEVGAIVAITDSDGSGNFSVEVPKSGGLQAISFKSGAPNLAGLTDYSIEASSIA